VLFVPDNVLEAFELPEAKDTHVLHLALLGSVGEWIRDGPLADLWEMGADIYARWACAAPSYPNSAVEKLAAG
jgi:hypothetical protein